MYLAYGPLSQVEWHSGRYHTPVLKQEVKLFSMVCLFKGIKNMVVKVSIFRTSIYSKS